MVNLGAPEVKDCLSDEAPPALKAKCTELKGAHKVTTEVVDGELAEADWEFK